MVYLFVCCWFSFAACAILSGHLLHAPAAFNATEQPALPPLHSDACAAFDGHPLQASVNEEDLVALTVGLIASTGHAVTHIPHPVHKFGSIA